jgi:hypothetical protein
VYRSWNLPPDLQKAALAIGPFSFPRNPLSPNLTGLTIGPEIVKNDDFRRFEGWRGYFHRHLSNRLFDDLNDDFNLY